MGETESRTESKRRTERRRTEKNTSGMTGANVGDQGQDLLLKGAQNQTDQLMNQNQIIE